jgi:hypothetical protein
MPLVIFETGSCFMPGLEHDPPILCWDDRYALPCPDFFPLRWGLVNLLSRLAWNCDPPSFSLPQLGWQVHITLPSYWLRWIFFCLGWSLTVIFLSSASLVTRIIAPALQLASNILLQRDGQWIQLERISKEYSK